MVKYMGSLGTAVLAWIEPPKHKLFVFNSFQLYLTYKKYV